MNWADANAQAQAQVQMQTQGHEQGKAQCKRGRAAASGEDGLRIVLVQLKNSLHDPATTSIASVDTLMSMPSPLGPVSDPCKRPASLSIVDGPSVDMSSTTHLPSPADPEEQAAMVSVFL